VHAAGTRPLSTREKRAAAVANNAQCAELLGHLAQRATAHTVAFGGDLNRPGSCAPQGMWTRTDGSARQSPGRQQVYGTTATLSSPSEEVLPARHTDHDVLLVQAKEPAPGGR